MYALTFDAMWKKWPVVLLILGFSACGNKSAGSPWDEMAPPKWEMYKAEERVPQRLPSARNLRQISDPGRFTFFDLKNESDASLAFRLLGENGKRIAYIDRHPDRWQYYSGETAAIESVDLYTHPSELGSQYGLCGVEKYEIKFDDKGIIESVESSERFGIEGNIFQKKNFDWGKYTKMCEASPASHAPSYFPASDSIAAHDAALVLVTAIDINASSINKLPFEIACTREKKSCASDARSYLSKLRLREIDNFSRAGCPVFGTKPKDVCFTVQVGQNRLGRFPKYITVQGSTYMNNVRVDSVQVIESFTIS